MPPRRHVAFPPWALFALPLAFAVLVIGAILAGGPLLGFLVAALVTLGVVAVAVRARPRGVDGAAADGAAAGASTDEWKAAAARRFAVVALVGTAGAVVAVVTTGVGEVIGWGVIAVAISLAISLTFLEVGYSEDRAREAESRRRRTLSPRGFWRPSA